MDSSFEYILPSNTSSARYPNNSASHYTTVPNNPLQLEGAWEVGVKSVFYNSHIGDLKEKAAVKLDYEKRITTFVKDVYPMKYKVTSDNKWDYSWRKVPTFNVRTLTPQSTLYEIKAYEKAIAKQLTEWRNVIVEDNQELFWYTNNYPYMYYFTAIEGFTIKFKHVMAKFLGYQWHVYLSKQGRFRVRSQLFRNAKLTTDDHEIMVFDPNVIKRETRIILKPKGESVLSQDEFVKRWQERVVPHLKSNVEFKKDKLVVHLYNAKAAVVFNRCLLDTIRCDESLFGFGTYWANHVYYPSKEGIKPEEDDWIVDVYSDELRSDTTSRILHYNDEVCIRQYTIPKLLVRLSRQLTRFVKQHGSTESVQLALNDNFVQVKLPRGTTLEFTSNLMSMLGFSQPKLEELVQVGSILPATLDKREQEIFIHLDIIDLMNYGTGKRQMLQHFVHNKDASHGIVERFFNPIIYQPVTKKMIESLTIEFIGGHHQRLIIKDSKSIVTLHFRKVSS